VPVPHLPALKTYLVDLGQSLDLRSVQHSEGQADHLQVLGSSSGRDVSRLRADIVDDGLLQPGYQKVGSFVDNLLLDTRQSVEDDCSTTASHVV